MNCIHEIPQELPRPTSALLYLTVCSETFHSITDISALGTVHAPEYRAGLGQDVSTADEIGIALVIAGDTSNPLSRPVVPIVLTTGGPCSGGASRIDSNGPSTVFPCQRFDPCLTGR